eukprot:267643_1
MFASLLFFCIHIDYIVNGDYKDCGYYFADYDVTFDLSPLTLTSETELDYYTVPNDDGGYEFMFNLCSDLVSMPYPGACNFYDQYVYAPSYLTRFGNTTSQAWQAEAGGNG